jgi:hypothetical protein
MPTAGRRLLRRLEIGLPRRCAPGVGLRRRKRYLPVGAGRPSAEGPWRPNSFGTYADHRPKAFTPIEIGPSRRCAPGVGLRRRKTPSRSAQADHRPKAFTPIEIGLPRRCAPGVGLRRRKTPSRSAQANHWPKASGGRIHSARMPTIGRRPPRSNSFDAQHAGGQPSPALFGFACFRPVRRSFEGEFARGSSIASPPAL